MPTIRDQAYLIGGNSAFDRVHLGSSLQRQVTIDADVQILAVFAYLAECEVDEVFNTDCMNLCAGVESRRRLLLLAIVVRQALAFLGFLVGVIRGFDRSVRLSLRTC